MQKHFNSKTSLLNICCSSVLMKILVSYHLFYLLLFFTFFYYFFFQTIQLLCIACGNAWYASRDEISSLTIAAPSVVGNVGTAPWATAKFDTVEKTLVSPRESEKPAADIFQKSTAAYMPVLETQKSFNKPRTEDPSTAADKTE